MRCTLMKRLLISTFTSLSDRFWHVINSNAALNHRGVRADKQNRYKLHVEDLNHIKRNSYLDAAK